MVAVVDEASTNIDIGLLARRFNTLSGELTRPLQENMLKVSEKLTRLSIGLAKQLIEREDAPGSGHVPLAEEAFCRKSRAQSKDNV
jgi:hypothetical protein